MAEATSAIPVGVYPYLTVQGGKAAVDFYTRAFGANESGARCASHPSSRKLRGGAETTRTGLACRAGAGWAATESDEKLRMHCWCDDTASRGRTKSRLYGWTKIAPVHRRVILRHRPAVAARVIRPPYCTPSLTCRMRFI